MNMSNAYYEGLGLIEAVLSIVIVGILAIVFLTFAAHSTLELVRMEQYDLLTVETQKSSEMFRTIVEKYNNGNDDVFFNMQEHPLTKDSCYLIEGTITNPVLERNSYCTINDTSGCRAQVLTKENSKNDLTFALYCFNSFDSDTGLLKGSIVSGLKKCAKDDDSLECKVKDNKVTIFNKLERDE